MVAKELLRRIPVRRPGQLRADRPEPATSVGGTCCRLATDGAFFPDGRAPRAARLRPARSSTASPGSRRSARSTCPEQEQGEGIAVDDDARVYVSSEGVNAAVLEVPLPAGLRDVVAPEPTPSPSPSASATPGLSREGRELPEEEPTGSRDAGQWLLGTVVFVGAVAVVLVAVRPRSGRRVPDSPLRVLDGVRVAPTGWVRAAPPEDLARPARLDEEARRDRGSSTSTSTASGSLTPTRSGSATW